MQVGEFRKGSHLLIQGVPCTCVEVSFSRTGEQGHTKEHIVALDIVTGEELEEFVESSASAGVVEVASGSSVGVVVAMLLGSGVAGILAVGSEVASSVVRVGDVAGGAACGGSFAHEDREGGEGFVAGGN